jgi:TRAP-type C4-dicarboxylate transport system permease small subunit
VSNQDDDGGTSPHRDDHEAAIQRADALERELEDERAKGDKNDERIAKLEREVADLRKSIAARPSGAASSAGKPVSERDVDEVQNKIEHLTEDDEKKSPPQRRHESQPTMDVGPASRASEISLDSPLSHPDDGSLSRLVRKVDDAVGMLEQGVLFFLLAAVVVTASLAAIYDKVLHEHLGRWWYTVVRGGTFTIAMFGAAYATHQQRHLAMDLVSRRLSPRGRLILGTLLKIFTIVIAAVLFRSGMHQREHVGGLGEEFVSDKTIVTLLPVGCALIILHSLLHIVIDVDYLVRGKLPPEKARTGH